MIGHAKNPTWGFGPRPEFPSGYTLVAAVDIPQDAADVLNDMGLLEMAFRLTNSIDCFWGENAGVTFLLNTEGTRSTSVGDVAVFPDGRVFYCANFGWEPLNPAG
jgi:hypothetical protein